MSSSNLIHPLVSYRYERKELLSVQSFFSFLLPFVVERLSVNVNGVKCSTKSLTEHIAEERLNLSMDASGGENSFFLKSVSLFWKPHDSYLRKLFNVLVIGLKFSGRATGQHLQGS